MLWRWLFDTPWWMIALLLGIGAVLFVIGNRRQDKQIMYGGGVFLLLGIALILLSWLIDTDLEKAEKRVRGIAVEVEHGTELWFCNTSPVRLDVTLPDGFASAAVLDASSFAEAARRPDLLDTLRPAAGPVLTLDAFAVVRAFRPA